MRKDLPKAGSVISTAEAKALLQADKLEDEIQRESVNSLRSLGCTVLIHNAGLRKEAAAALKKAGITKGAVFATPGCPDISFRKPNWAKGFWCLIEFKTLKGVFSAAQKIIHDAGGSYLCRSLDDVLAVLSEIEGVAVKNPSRMAA